MNRQYVSAIAVGIWLVGLHQPVGAQSSPELKITSPVLETTVQPGQMIQVVVTATDPSHLTSEAVGGRELGVSALQPAATQVTFNVTIPANVSPGVHYLKAMGIPNGASAPIYSKVIALIVPVPGQPLSLSVSNNPLIIRAPGVTLPLDVTLVTSQGRFTVDPQQFLSFVSSNPDVASVDGNGIVTGQTAGRTQASVSYTNGTNTVSTTVAVQVLGGMRGDLNGDGQVDSDDLNIIDLGLNTPANGPNDARDLNHDGVINALDARMLTTLCTYPRCATQ